MDIATLVNNITTAFEKASSLVQRIRDRKESEPNAQTEPIDDLLESLSLGPTVVRGYYESDARRFGNAYMTGDSIAREQLKDALINLQMTVLSSLGAIILDDQDPDYDAIQAASDDCRVNVGVCLGQLSQRMSKAARGHNVAGRIPVYDNGQVIPVQRSASRSTHSGVNRAPPMTPPESDTEFLGENGLFAASRTETSVGSAGPPADTPLRQQKFKPRSSEFESMTSMPPPSQNGLHYFTQEPTANMQMLSHRLSTMPLSKSPESPISPQDPGYANLFRTRESSVSTGTASSRSNNPSMLYQQTGQEVSGYGEMTIENMTLSYPNTQQSNEINKLNPYYELPSTTLGRSQSTSSNGVMSRKPILSMHDNTMSQSPISMQPYSQHMIAEVSEEKEVYHAPPVPDRAPLKAPSHPRTVSTTSSNTLQRLSTGPLTLPTDKNLLGFCKGAFRLQAGMEKKAFGVANRPLGYSAMLQYWKCDKCYFEGQCTTIVPPGGKKPERIFDPVIRDYNGIRYKWAFLAKCHVPLKTMPEGRRDGSFGSFGCIFCTAEAAQRGWPVITNDHNARRTSVKSTGSGGPLTNGTLVFGNIHGLMDHLQMHRQPEFYPGVEVQGRMKCVVGRIAQRGEEFDINLHPLE